MAEEDLDKKAMNIAKVTDLEAEVLEKVLQAIRQIKFGYVQITIQDARVVQIDRTEKDRISRKD